MIWKPTVLILFIIPFISTFAQKEIVIYRTYVKEDNKQERISFEEIKNKKTGFYSYAFYFSDDYYNKEYFNSNNDMIANINGFDSLYYEYFKKDSAIIFSIREGEKTRNKKLIYNKKGEVVLELGYLYKTNQFATVQRNTYQGDTLQLGSADFHITTLFGETDTSQTDSSFITYDKDGRITGEYQLTRYGEIDSMLITEYTYTDSTETMWGYEKLDSKYVLYKRCVDFYDKDHDLITRLRYNFPDVYDGKTEYTYELSDDKKHRYTKTSNEYRIDGSIWKTRAYRWEVVEK